MLHVISGFHHELDSRRALRWRISSQPVQMRTEEIDGSIVITHKPAHNPLQSNSGMLPVLADVLVSYQPSC